MKRAIVAVTFYREDEFPDDYEDHTIFFSAEENSCLANHITAEAADIEKTPGRCSFCCKAHAEVIAIDGKLVSDRTVTDDDLRAMAFFAGKR